MYSTSHVPEYGSTSRTRARTDTSNVPEYGYCTVHSCPGVRVQYIPCSPGVREYYYARTDTPNVPEYRYCTVHPMSRSTGVLLRAYGYIQCPGVRVLYSVQYIPCPGVREY